MSYFLPPLENNASLPYAKNPGCKNNRFPCFLRVRRNLYLVFFYQRFRIVRNVLNGNVRDLSGTNLSFDLIGKVFLKLCGVFFVIIKPVNLALAAGIFHGDLAIEGSVFE
jgi:hypothetical protein